MPGAHLDRYIRDRKKQANKTESNHDQFPVPTAFDSICFSSLSAAIRSLERSSHLLYRIFKPATHHEVVWFLSRLWCTGMRHAAWMMAAPQGAGRPIPVARLPL